MAGDCPFSPAVVAAIKLEYTNPGIHGWQHIKRVAEIGVRLSAFTKADTKVVFAFALLHDAARYNDGPDLLHGNRAADLYVKKYQPYLGLNNAQSKLLCEALIGHNFGHMSKDPTIATCWDADRLDITRCSTAVDYSLLNTDAAMYTKFFTWATSLHEREVING